MSIGGMVFNASIKSVGLLFAVLMPAQQLSLHLRHGDYVQESVACKDAPFAAILSWNGASFPDPHSSQCRSRLLAQSGNRYDISNTCAALGDGTPDRSGYVDRFTITRLSDSRFALTKGGKSIGIYRWCNASVGPVKSVKP